MKWIELEIYGLGRYISVAETVGLMAMETSEKDDVQNKSKELISEKPEEYKYELKHDVAKVEEQATEATKAIEKEIAKLRDPTVHAALMFATVREKENANRLLKNIYGKLDMLSEKIERIEQKLSNLKIKSSRRGVEKTILSGIDENILNFVKSSGQTTAQQVQKEFRYKGRNAASARLSRLSQMGLLVKQRAGKVIYYADAESKA